MSLISAGVAQDGAGSAGGCTTHVASRGEGGHCTFDVLSSSGREDRLGLQVGGPVHVTAKLHEVTHVAYVTASTIRAAPTGHHVDPGGAWGLLVRRGPKAGK